MDSVWYQSYAPGVPKTINPDSYPSLLEPLEHYFKQYANFIAFSNMGSRLSYQAVEQYSQNFARYLQSVGLKRGDRIAIMLPNLLQYPVALFGVLRAGLVVVNVNPLYTAPELLHILKDSEVRGIIVLSNFAKTVETVIQDFPLAHVIVTDVGDMLGPVKGRLINAVVKYIKRAVPRFRIPQACSFKRALCVDDLPAYRRPLMQKEDLAFLQYTGGTTGTPKGVMLTHRNMLANLMQTHAWVGSEIKPGRDVVLGALPLYHIFSLTVCCLTFMSLGAECLLITNPRDLKGLVKSIKELPLTVFVGINTLFNGLLNRDDFKSLDFSRLKLTVAGGMAVQPKTAKNWKRVTGVCVLQGYGLTETSPVVTINPTHLTDFNESIGVPVPNTDVMMCDDVGEPVAAGMNGELYVKGPQVMLGYWRNPEATAGVLTETGWLKTGDIAYMDEQGFLYIVDRKKEMILVSGFNVYPSEVEAVIASHPDVKEVAVVGVPDEVTGEKVKAFIVKQAPSLNEALVIEHCRRSLTHYKIPKSIEFRDDLPKSNVGKVLKRTLQSNT